MDYADFLTGVYQDQLGREPDPEGAAYWLNALVSGQLTQDQVQSMINQSVEGQNYDTQLLTSEYRQLFGRDPEQAGYQYWLSRMQLDPTMDANTIESIIRASAQGTDITAMENMPLGYTELFTAALQADPWAGRRALESIYGISPDTPNISTLGGLSANFVNPVTMQPVISTYDPATNTFTSNAGADLLDPYRVSQAIRIAAGSGALSKEGATSIMNDLAAAQNMNDVYAALSKPQAGVVLDQIYGMQLGENVDITKARQEALQRQKVLDQFNYAPGYDFFGEKMVQAGLTNPFAPSNYTASTMAKRQYVVTPQNFQDLLNRTIQESFGTLNTVETPISPSYYSERGLEPGFTPRNDLPTFRSGVAGYTPNLPTEIQYGAQTVQAPINVFTPGIFNEQAVGYTPQGLPIIEKSMNQDMQFYDAQGNPMMLRPVAAPVESYTGA